MARAFKAHDFERGGIVNPTELRRRKWFGEENFSKGALGRNCSELVGMSKVLSCSAGARAELPASPSPPQVRPRTHHSSTPRLQYCGSDWAGERGIRGRGSFVVFDSWAGRSFESLVFAFELRGGVLTE
jgi:hypothetical protein